MYSSYKSFSPRLESASRSPSSFTSLIPLYEGSIQKAFKDLFRTCHQHQPFYTPLPLTTMDEQFIQEVRTVSHETVKSEFPDEEEYFDFLFDLIIPELQEMEPGKEAELLREMRGVHPLVLGCTSVVITVVFQVLARYTYRDMDTDDSENKLTGEIQKIIAGIVEDKNDQEEFSEVPKILIKNIKKAREMAKKSK